LVTLPYPDIDYNSFEVLAPLESDAAKFFEKSQDLYLCQSVENCTRFREGHSPSKLDYIFTKEENQVDSLCYDALLGKSDHCCLLFTFVLQSIESLAVPHMSNFNYWKGDYEAITQELDQTDWDSELNSKDTDEMWELIKNKIHELCLKHVPLKVHGTKSKRKNSWLSKATLKVIKQREAAWKRYRIFDSNSNFSEYKRLRNKAI